MDINLLRDIEKTTMESLKDFQCATVERVDELFRNGQNRVLVADEVGLGKTLIARGVISKTSIIQCEADDDLFKIVYICSNQVIAKQNIQKLDVFNIRPEEGADDSRLSMQHLKIAEQEFQSRQKGAFAQLIPLTPTTSFSMTNGGGTRHERALMFAILERIPKLDTYIAGISDFMSQNVSWWKWYVEEFEKKLQTLEAADMGYPRNVVDKVISYDRDTHILDALINHIKEIERDIQPSESGNSILRRLRVMFAEISVDMLQPDLVIMDEFQRFKYLIDSDSEQTENGMIARKFFETPNLKVLLLSATPYKLYSTIEEIEEADNPDDYYKEFIQVMDFLNNDTDKMRHFLEVWSDYSVALKEVIQGDTAVLVLKDKAQDEMYKLMCRTERISVMDTGDYIDDSSVKTPIAITSGDIHTYLDMGKMLESIGDDRTLLVDYAKSTPYLMSYMNHYKVKERAEKHFKNNPDDLPKAKGPYLWINRKTLEHYGELPSNNARLEELKRQIFNNRSELYMWVPPSNPYYDLEGVYKDSKGFSKILVFSAWEMVPKMIGSMISYEEERRTVGVLSNDAELKSSNNTYFTETKKRYPVSRLRFNVSGGEARGMYQFCLFYPSETLAEIYHPIEYMNEGLSLGEIKERLRAKLDKLMSPIIGKYSHDSVREDRRWYYMAPVLLDGVDYANDWIDLMSYEEGDEDDVDEDSGVSGFDAHLVQLGELIDSIRTCLGRVPADLIDVLVDMAIGSFAVCAFRSNGGDAQKASELAKVFINRFNSTEATAAVMLSYSDDDSFEGDGHWRNVLRYCCDGGFGAMLDEYVHMISEGAGFGLSENKNQEVHEAMIDALKIHSASYSIDTYPSFCKRMKKEKAQRTFMRSHYAVGFTKSEGAESKNVERKDSIRNAFNSPMRPFVLATTSIGQEGLDFHYYCRKIMHWNLPSNPIDLEQREGRINRYKCLAIRQDIAQRFSDRQFKSDVWQELFDMAVNEIRSSEQSELVPYWCLGEGQSVKIERIIPMYPVSKDEVNYQRLIKVLSLYRLTMGQTRQEELINYLLENETTDKKFINSLFINLSPYIRTDASWRSRMKSREPVVIEKKKTARQRRIEVLQAKLDELRTVKSALDEAWKNVKNYDIVGMVVTHNKWGDGMITELDGNYLTVDFDGNEKKMVMPDAFIEGFLTSEYEDFTENEQRRIDLSEQIKENTEALNAVEKELNDLII